MCLALLNKALFSKWIWWFAMEREAFLRQIIVGKYGKVEEGRCSKEVSDRYGIGLWKAIWKLWSIVNSMGNGRRVKF